MKGIYELSNVTPVFGMSDEGTLGLVGLDNVHRYGSSDAIVGVPSGKGVEDGVSFSLGVEDPAGAGPGVDGCAGPGPGVEGADVGVRAAARCMNLRFSVEDESPPAIVQSCVS